MPEIMNQDEQQEERQEEHQPDTQQQERHALNDDEREELRRLRVEKLLREMMKEAPTDEDVDNALTHTSADDMDTLRQDITALLNDLKLTKKAGVDASPGNGLRWKPQHKSLSAKGAELYARIKSKRRLNVTRRK